MNSEMTIPTHEPIESEPLHAWLFPLRTGIYAVVCLALVKSPLPFGDLHNSSPLILASRMFFALWIGQSASTHTTEEFYKWLRRFDWVEQLNKNRRFDALTKICKGAIVWAIAIIIAIYWALSLAGVRLST